MVGWRGESPELSLNCRWAVQFAGMAVNKIGENKPNNAVMAVFRFVETACVEVVSSMPALSSL